MTLINLKIETLSIASVWDLIIGECCVFSIYRLDRKICIFQNTNGFPAKNRVKTNIFGSEIITVYKPEPFLLVSDLVQYFDN